MNLHFRLMRRLDLYNKTQENEAVLEKVTKPPPGLHTPQLHNQQGAGMRQLDEDRIIHADQSVHTCSPSLCT